MVETLIERLRAFATGCRGSMWQSRDDTIRLCDDAADRIEALEREVKELRVGIAKLDDERTDEAAALSDEVTR